MYLRVLVIVSLSIALTAGSLASSPQAGEQVRAVADAVWERQLQTDIQARLREGLPVESLPDISIAQARDDAEFARGVVEQLEAIDARQLEHDDWLTREIMLFGARNEVEGLQYWGFTNLLTPYSSPIGSLRQLFGSLPLNNEEDALRYLAVLREVPDMVRQIEALAREQLAAGLVVSTENMAAVTGIVRAVTQPADVGPFAISDARGAALGATVSEWLRADIARLVDEQVNPSLTRLSEFLEGEYAAAAPAGVGLSQYEGGRPYYDFRVRLMTTMDVTAEQVNATGRDVLAEMQAEMQALQQQMGFDGTVAEYREHMRSDPANFPESVDRVAAELLEPTSRFFERADEFFKVLPKAPFGVERLDPALEGSQTFGYYSPPNPVEPRGVYHYNGSNLDQRSWVPLAGIGFHELFPGHHFHIARQMENESLHPLRRNTMHGAYTEGWGSYSSLLGLEQGAVTDPQRRYGVWMLEVFLANRLVVDTGMNALGMSLEEARQFMREHTFEADSQIASETLRYSTDMPAQALAYQMGKRAIVGMRERARQQLGDRFDLREFHEAVLGPGSMPMTVLQEHIDWWVRQQLGEDR